MADNHQDTPAECETDTLISVIIPVYNSADSLSRCLDSLKAQTYRNLQIICINDGSTDRSQELLEQYAANTPNLCIIHQENCGQSVARNNGLSHAKGRYIGFVDADDWIDPGYFESLYQTIKQTGADIAMAGTRHYHTRNTKEESLQDSLCTSFTEKIQAQPHGGVWNKLYDAEFIRAHQLTFPEGVFWEDNLFVIKALYYSQKLAITDNPNHYNYDQRAGSTTRSSSQEDKLKQDGLAMLQMISDFMESVHCPSETRRVVFAFCTRQFIIDAYLLDDRYYQQVIAISGSEGKLAHRRRRIRRRTIKRRILKKLRSFFFLSRGEEA